MCCSWHSGLRYCSWLWLCWFRCSWLWLMLRYSYLRINRLNHKVTVYTIKAPTPSYKLISIILCRCFRWCFWCSSTMTFLYSLKLYSSTVCIYKFNCIVNLSWLCCTWFSSFCGRCFCSRLLMLRKFSLYLNLL